MEVNLDKIRENYAQMSDLKLERIAKSDIASLHPDVVPIVKEEIKKRGLDENLYRGIEAQTTEFTEEQVYAMRDKIKSLSCPKCGEHKDDLYGGIIRKVRSYIVFTSYQTKSLIACRSCVEGERKAQLIKNSLLGWWGFPWGLFIHTPHSIINHFLDLRKREETSEALLIGFALENIGELTTNWEDEDALVEFIHHHNNQ